MPAVRVMPVAAPLASWLMVKVVLYYKMEKA
jgi:hypothetical protein